MQSNHGNNIWGRQQPGNYGYAHESPAQKTQVRLAETAEGKQYQSSGRAGGAMNIITGNQ
ncbi:MAG: hypothetical protein ACPF9Z_08840 [Paracoccaceae bacterium]